MAKLQTSVSVLAARPRSGDGCTERTIQSIKQGYAPAVWHGMGYGIGPACDNSETAGADAMACAVRECNK